VVLLAAVVSGLVVAAAPSPAEAHRGRARVRYGYRAYVGGGGAVIYGPHGWYAGAGLAATKIFDQRGGPEHLDDGAGVALYGGFRLGQRLSLEVGYLASFHNPATVDTVWGPETDFLVLEALTGDARIFLGRSGNIDGYVQGGVGAYVLGSEHFGVDAVGTGFQLGGGFDWYFSDVWALGLRALYRGIAMGPPDGTGDTDVFISGATVEASLGFHF
jgi:hypothetical protein